MMKLLLDLLEAMPPAEKRTALHKMRLIATGKAVLARMIQQTPAGSELSAQLIALRDSVEVTV